MWPLSPVWNQPSVQGLSRLLGLLPVAREHVIGAGQDLAVLVGPDAHADGRDAGPGLQPGPLGGLQPVPLGRRAVHGEQRGRLGQAVDLDELPAQLGLDALDGLRRRRRAGHHDAGQPGAGHVLARREALGPGVEDGRDDGRRPAHQGHAVGLDPAQDLLAVDLAHDDLGRAHARHRIGHAPPVAVEHGQRVHEHVPVGDGRVPAEGGRVEPAVPVGELDALGASRRAAGVVDARGGVLVGLPPDRLGAVGGRAEQGLVGDAVQHDAVLGGHVPERLVGLGVHEQDGRARVLDDVADLLGVQPVVDRDQHPAVTADPEVGDLEARGVGADDRDPLALAHPEVVQGDGHPARAALQLRVCERAQGPGGPWLVDHSRAPAVYGGTAAEKVSDRERHLHGDPL